MFTLELIIPLTVVIMMSGASILNMILVKSDKKQIKKFESELKNWLNI